MARLAALLLLLALAPFAAAQNPCDDCLKSALAGAALCHTAAMSPTEAADCSVKMGDAQHKCQRDACAAEVAARRYALCADCLKDAQAEAGKCAALPAAERKACATRAGGMKKSCQERFCQTSK
jgi:hypothetical protein